MHAIIRSYSGAGANELFDLIELRNADIEKLLGQVPGFVSYTLIRNADGGQTVTVCRDKTGTDESTRVAREWIQQNAPDLKVSPPTVSEGAVPFQVP